MGRVSGRFIWKEEMMADGWRGGEKDADTPAIS
jgi:hypothetical protein